MTEKQEIPSEFEWRYVRFRRGVDPHSFFPVDSTPAKFLMRHTSVWFEEDEGIWYASIVPNEACKNRSSMRGSTGATPHEALDTEVSWWLATALFLPGAKEMLASAQDWSAQSTWPQTSG